LGGEDVGVVVEAISRSRYSPGIAAHRRVEVEQAIVGQLEHADGEHCLGA
jgi:hypothetical protein